MKGSACNGCNGYDDYDGDPSMLILNSNNQMQKEAVFESATTPDIRKLIPYNL